MNCSQGYQPDDILRLPLFVFDAPYDEDCYQFRPAVVGWTAVLIVGYFLAMVKLMRTVSSDRTLRRMALAKFSIYLSVLVFLILVLESPHAGYVGWLMTVTCTFNWLFWREFHVVQEAEQVMVEEVKKGLGNENRYPLAWMGMSMLFSWAGLATVATCYALSAWDVSLVGWEIHIAGIVLLGYGFMTKYLMLRRMDQVLVELDKTPRFAMERTQSLFMWIACHVVIVHVAWLPMLIYAALFYVSIGLLTLVFPFAREEQVEGL